MKVTVPAALSVHMNSLDGGKGDSSNNREQQRRRRLQDGDTEKLGVICLRAALQLKAVEACSPIVPG